MWKKITLLLLFVLSIDVVYAATLHGTIYDLNLRPASGIVVQINSTPRQRFLSRDGTYSFELSPADYRITADYNSYHAEENISIKNEGVFVYDLFLFPELDEGTLDENVDVGDSYFEKSYWWLYAAVIVVIILVVVAAVVLLKKTKNKPKEKTKANEETDELDKVIEFIKKSGNRVTQKEIRKEFPLSEAKISLMIAELEEKGIVKKIKKGRGNIIILQQHTKQ